MASSTNPTIINTVQIRDDDNFKRSYDQFQDYPQSLVYQTSYPWALEESKSRLTEQSARLFRSDGFEIPFRDFVDGGLNVEPEKQNCFNELDLKSRLGDLTSSTPVGRSITKRDPKCRFIFLSATDSREPLNLDKPMLLRILTYHQVMSGFLEFISIFGEKNVKNEARDLRYSGFREQITFNISAKTFAVPSLGRSGRQFQLCYNIKSIICKDDSDANVALADKEWSIRQGAFHHQFDIEEGTTLWIVCHGRKDIKERIQQLTGKTGKPEDRDFSNTSQCFKSSLAVHLVYCHWSTEGWRLYVQWLEEVIEEKTSRAIHERREGDNQYEYSPKDVQSVQYYEDRTNEAIMVLEANTNVLGSLRKFYLRLLRTKDFDLKKECKSNIVAFANQLDDMMYDSRMHIARAKVLVQITANRKSLILQHLQSQATQNQSEATDEMERLTKSMHFIGMIAQKEAIAMRIITVVTLVFLPATFVSTFFGTDIIKYQNQSNGSSNDAPIGPYMGSFSAVALCRWLQLTIPLTVLTIGLGYYFFRRAKRSAERKLAKRGLLPLFEKKDKDSMIWGPIWFRLCP